MTPQETMEARKQAEEILKKIKGEKPKFTFRELKLSDVKHETKSHTPIKH